MADIRSVEAFMRGRWAWERFGYEKQLPGRIGIGDIDGFVEYRKHHLFIEGKHATNSIKNRFSLPTGQRLAYESLVASYGGNRLLVVVGDATENNPLGAQVWQMSGGAITKREFDWTQCSIEERRKQLDKRIAAFVGWVDHRTGVRRAAS
jgi:hypothetical protein